jgi:ABC-type sulfate transport system permease subunit
VNGWDYGAGMRSIVLYGPACDAVKNMTTKTIQAIFGCPGVVIP